MPVQEALVTSADQLDRPGGVAFDPPCKSKDEDLRAWRALQPGLADQFKSGRVIMALIQTRNTRDWDDKAKNFAFKPAEDYLIAAYSVARKLGSPYVSGSCSKHWLEGALAKQTGAQVDRGSIDMFPVFQCSAQGCNLSFTGVTRLITFHQKQGLPLVEASAEALGSIGDAVKFGWRGSFPAGWVSARPRR